MIKAVIFDVDDTLSLTGDKTVYGLIEVSKKIGLRVPTTKEVARLLGLPWVTMIKTLWPGIDVEDFIKSYEKYKTTNLPLSCVRGAKEAVAKVQKNFLAGIITSRDFDTLTKVMKKCGISLDSFEYLECDDQNNFSKPDPRVFDNLKKDLSRKEITHEEIVYVGDAIYDYQAANGAGLHFVAFLNGAYTKEEFVKEGLNPILTIKLLDELTEKIDTISVGVNA